jgi:predicted dehydrogenase
LCAEFEHLRVLAVAASDTIVFSADVVLGGCKNFRPDLGVFTDARRLRDQVDAFVELQKSAFTGPRGFRQTKLEMIADGGGVLILIGVIGYGYWGPNLVRNCFESKEAQVACVSDLREDRLAVLAGRYPTIKTTRDCRELIEDPSIDAVAIATPVSTHYELALRALQEGKHVLVEKPLASDTGQVQHLMELAKKRNRVLMVDHTFVYTGSVRKIRELVDSGGLGEIYYYDSVRVNLGLFQHDVNVLWYLAVHDLAIMDYVLPFRPCAVSATGLSHVPGGTENIAYLTLFFEGNQIAHIHANWLAPVKLRQTLIGASRKMIVYDDLDQGEKIKVYDKGITLSNHQNPEKLYQMLVGYRT